MNTKQLIVLWYGSFIIIAFLVAFYSKQEILFQIIIIISILVTILLTYLTFRETKNVKREKVLKQGVQPIFVLVCFIGFLLILDNISTSQKTITVSPTIGIDKVEIIEPEFRIETNSAVSKAIFSGRIKNNSNRTIGWLIIRLRIYESTQPGLTINELREQLNSGNLRRNITTSYIQTLDKESMKYIGQQIDTEDVRSSNLNVPPGETKSFTIENLNTKIITSDFWVWDYEIIRVW